MDYYERCCLLLKEELGATPEAATVALYEQIRAGKVTTSSVVEKKTRRLQDQPGHTPTAPTLQPEVPVHEGRQRIVTLPAPPTALIGREQTVDAVINRFRNHMGRLLTLVGPPGIGKSRLGIAVASRLQDSYRDGVYYIPLAAVNEPTLVAEVLLAAFSLTTPNAKPAQLRVIDYLKRKELLLVLDNFEQITAAAPLLAEVLSECPGVQMLVTSRERLHLRAELCYPVPTLDLVAAAELFVQRAQAVSETVVLTANEQIIVAQICQTLDCLPLALELSAARLDILSLPQILTRLHDRRLDLLTDGPRDLPPYQRTLRNAIHRSYTLLDNEEQALFRCASVFASGFELAAISTFGFHERQLQSLVSKNLVKTEIVANSERRYWLLDTLREYASEQLVVQLDGENSKPILKGVVGETYRVWSLLAFELGRLEQSEALLKQSSQLFTEIGDKARVDANAGQAGLLAFYQGDLERARALYHSGLDAASTSGQKGTMIILSHLIGTVEMRWGDWPQAQAHYIHALSLSTKDEFYPQDLGSYLWRIAELMAQQRNTTVAATLLGASEALFSAWHSTLAPIYHAEYTQVTRMIREQLDATAFTRAYNQGYTMPEEEAALYALAALRKIESPSTFVNDDHVSDAQ